MCLISFGANLTIYLSGSRKPRFPTWTGVSTTGPNSSAFDFLLDYTGSTWGYLRLRALKGSSGPCRDLSKALLTDVVTSDPSHNCLLIYSLNGFLGSPSVGPLCQGEISNFVSEWDESGNDRKLGKDVGRKKQSTNRKIYFRFHFWSKPVCPHPGEFVLVFGSNMGSQVHPLESSSFWKMQLACSAGRNCQCVRKTRQ